MAITVTGANAIEKSSKTTSLQVINDNCNYKQVEALKKMAEDPQLRELLTEKTISQIKKNYSLLKTFL